MIQRPRLKTYLTVFPIAENTWGIRGGTDELWRIQLRDQKAFQVFSSLLPYLDGQHRTEEILKDLEGAGLQAGAVEQLLRHLESSLLIEEAEPSGLTPEDEEEFKDQLAFFSRFSQQGGGRHQAHLLQSVVGVLGDGALASSVLRQLELVGIGTVIAMTRSPAAHPSLRHPSNGNGTGERHRTRIFRHTLSDLRQMEAVGECSPPQVLVVAQESHDPKVLEETDALSKQLGLPWLLVRCLSAWEGWVGPLFIPGETASYLSLEARLKGNMPFFHEYNVLTEYLRSQDQPAPRSGGLFSFLEILSGIAAAEVVKLLTGIAVPQLAGRFLTLNLSTWETEIHDVLRIPRLDSETVARPIPYPWKEVPYVNSPTRRV